MGLAPDSPHPHYVLSVIYYNRNMYKEAEASIDEAIAMDPFNSSFYAQKSQICYRKRRWQDALNAAELGLEIDAEDVECVNIRAMTLVKLGRQADAAKTIDKALERDPENAFSHANVGWTLLEKGDYKNANEHFREALRLQPDLEWARQGVIESIKSQSIFYRWILGYFLWMQKLSSAGQWAFVIVGFVLYQVLLYTSERNEALSPYILPILVLYIGFVVLTWTANPLSNLILRLNKFGRLALSREEKMTSNLVALFFFPALGCALAYFIAFDFEFIIYAIICVLMIPPISTIFKCEKGWPRDAIITVSILLALIGLGSASLSILSRLSTGDLSGLLGGLSSITFLVFAIAALASQFLANYLVSVEVKL